MLLGDTSQKKKKEIEGRCATVFNTQELSVLRATRGKQKSKKGSEEKRYKPTMPLTKPIIYYNTE